MAYNKNTWQNGDIITAEKLNNVESGVEEINMSYEKTTWETGDVITAEKLNNIEDGIAGAGGGDYTTAQVTLINSADTSVVFDMPIIASDDEEDFHAVSCNMEVAEGETNVNTVVLYKGMALGGINGMFHNYIIISASSGDVEIEDSEYATITGDCSITFARAN